MAGKKIFITGISGFVGRCIAENALKRGYQVSGIDRSGGKITGAEVFKEDINNLDVLERLMKGSDYVIHLAAVTSNLAFEADMYNSYKTNVLGFLNVIQTAAKCKCKKFLYASSAAVYTDTDRFSERVIIDIRKQKNHYAKTKLINEMIAKSYEYLYKFDIVGLRYFNIYGSGENDKGDYKSIISQFVKCAEEKKSLVIYGNGKQSRDFIHVTDVAKITLELLKKGRSGVYNVGTGKSTSFTEIARMINKDDIAYIKNPLTTYQLYTKAENDSILKVLNGYQFIEVKEGIELLKNGR